MKKIEKGRAILTVLLGIAGIFVFAWPAIRYSVCNIGNVTGEGISLCLFFGGILQKKIHRLCVAIWKKKVGKIVLSLFAIGALIALLLVNIITGCMISAQNKEPAKDATALVLGCKVKNGRPSLTMEERLKAAYKYLSEHPDANCVVSGGKGDDENISEAQCMYENLVKRGISKERIFKEDQSTSTRENFAFSMEIIKKNNLNTELAIITNEFHEYRAGKIAQNMKVSYGAVPAKTVWWLYPTFYVREWYGILYQWIL